MWIGWVRGRDKKIIPKTGMRLVASAVGIRQTAKQHAAEVSTVPAE
jgi:hypothetical protein